MKKCTCPLKGDCEYLIVTEDEEYYCSLESTSEISSLEDDYRYIFENVFNRDKKKVYKMA